MINLSPPHAVLNDPRAPVFVQMRTTFVVSRTGSREYILDLIANAAESARGGRLQNVVINCHGNPGHLELGQGFHSHHAGLFRRWRGKVSKVWLRACRVAQRDAFGYSLVRGIARAAECHVVASTELQTEVGGRRLPYGQLDTFEGLVMCFGPSGQVSWQRRNRSTYVDHRGQWTRNPD